MPPFARDLQRMARGDALMLAAAGRFIRILFLVRVAVITLILMPLLGYLAFGPLRPYLAGVFNQEESCLRLVAVSMAACLTAAAAVTTVNLTLWYGTERFELPFATDPQRFPLLIFFAGLVSAAWLYVYVCLLTPTSVVLCVAAGITGFLIAAALVFAAKFVQLALTDPVVTPHPPPYLVFPADRLPVLGNFLTGVYQRHPGRVGSAFKRLFSRLSRLPLRLLALSGDGYLVPNRNPRTLLSGHVFAGSLAVIAVMAYLLIGYVKQIDIGQAVRFSVPSLTYVLLFLMVMCWFFAGLAFFLDRFRFPIILAFVLLTLLTSNVPRSDHFFRLLPNRGRTSLQAPAEIMANYGSGRVPVVVAAAGGGIQAAAWTTRVLDQLASDCRHATPTCDFRASLMLFSGVSGGSVGGLHVGATFPEFGAAAKNSMQSSLDDIAWAWINPDLRRAVFPWSVGLHIDRGWALERSLEEIEEHSGHRLRNVPLSEWAGRAGRDLPVFLFNATAVEKGAPLVFATSQYHPKRNPDPGFANGISFFDHYQGQDVPVATAARMSATFPYVSPAARADDGLHKGSWHVVDGGYYDNYGLFTAMEWLEDALEHLSASQRPKRIVIVRVTSFPAATATDQVKLHGWGLQPHAPLDAFLNVRTTAQADESVAQLRLFEAYWAGRSVEICDELVEYPDGLADDCRTPPLSWRLTMRQQACVTTDAWRDERVRNSIASLVDLLRGRR